MSKKVPKPNRFKLAVAITAASAQIVIVFSASNAHSQNQDVVSASVSLPTPPMRVAPVIVSGSRAERANEDVPATVTVISADEIEKKRTENIKDLVADEPAVTVKRQPARFSAAGSGGGRDGNAGFNIRGIDGNRVLIQLDGIRIPSAFIFGATNIGRGDYIDLSTISRVEILRGPASALYGSDGLAGAVSFFTRDAAELLRKSGGNTYAALAGGYSSDDKSTSATAIAAARNGQLDLLGIVSTRSGKALENFGTIEGIGSARTTPNPAKSSGESGMLKWAYRPDNDQKITLTLDKSKSGTNTDVLTGRVSVLGFTGVSVSSLLAFDDTDRSRGTIQYSHSALRSAFADSVSLSLYAQDASSRQLSYEFRTNNTSRIRDQRYGERVIGVSSEVEKQINGNVSHRIVYGVDAASSEFVGNTDGTLPPRGETFPVKRFPDTDYNVLGVFVQDEIGFANNRVLVIPALRFDRYSLKPEASGQFPSGIPAASSGSNVSPKIGVVWKFIPTHSVYMNLASGYKAPAPNEVNQGFTNTTSFYQSVASPDLKPEKNLTVEIGLRKIAGTLTYEAAAFTGRYKNFIEQVQVGGTFTANDPTLFRYVNLSKVRLSGAEGKIRYDINSNVGINAGAAYTKGKQETNGLRSPLNSVNPLRALANVSWRSTDGHSGAELGVHYGASKNEADITQPLARPPTPPVKQFAPAASTTLDASAYWQFHRMVRMTIAVRNVTDKKYWNWSDVQGLSSASTTLDAYTQPGRSYSMGLKVEF
jgi:hemoglobin/transferrin/lactoferrin receptor protein